jgi:hypothetical protein
MPPSPKQPALLSQYLRLACRAKALIGADREPIKKIDDFLARPSRLTTRSLEEAALMRLKTAQREKEHHALEGQIRREGKSANAAAAAAPSVF